MVIASNLSFGSQLRDPILTFSSHRVNRATQDVVRTVGIAIGSLVAAYLALSLVAGALFGWTGKDSPLAGFLVVVLGGLVFADIMRRDRRRAENNVSHLNA